MSEAKTYTFGGQEFELAEPVYGVMERFVLFSLRLGKSVVDVSDLVATCGARLPEYAAGMIVPKGTSPQDADIPAIAEILRGERSTKIQRVVTDFFGHPDFEEEVLAMTQIITNLAGSVQGGSPGLTPPETSNGKSAPSPAETSSNGIESDGKSAPVNPETT
jgi:hypothetical protein